jgi:hypothetical protein
MHSTLCLPACPRPSRKNLTQSLRAAQRRRARELAALCRRQLHEDDVCPVCGLLLFRPWTRALFCSPTCRLTSLRHSNPIHLRGKRHEVC